jgi:pimeloyl-ACP methyl ester carboxylesterase
MTSTSDGTDATFRYDPKHVETPCGRLAIFDEGEGEVVVLVHGLVGSFMHFQHVAPELVRTHRVIGIDMPGCGGSERCAHTYSVNTYAHALLDALTALGVERATLVGHSAGGQVVARAAAMAPHRVSRLVMLNPSGLQGYPRVLRYASRVLLHPRLVAALLGATAHRIIDFIFHQKNEYTAQFAREQTAATGEVDTLLLEMGKVFRDIGPDLLAPGIIDNAHALRMPMLVIWGDRDRLAPLKRVRRAVGKLPGAKLHVIERCGHMPMIESPGETLSVILPFLLAAVAEASPAAVGGR